MSAIVSTQDDHFGGVRRYKTRCKLRIDSHNGGSGQNAEPLWLHEDIKAVQCSKTLKGAGQATVTLTASRNFLNIIFPNDYINIYFDISDGQGWTRTFFGFVDRIEESYEVDAQGRPTTQYHLVCTDFYKVFERTVLYFNPHLYGRSDLEGSAFATPNIGGLALASAGVQATGSPADMVQNIILITLGFGSQFILPPSYRPELQDVMRRRRAEYVQGRLSETAKQAIEDAGGNFEQLRQEQLAEARGEVEEASAEEQYDKLLDQYGVDPKQFGSKPSSEDLARAVADKKMRDLFKPSGDTRGNTAGRFVQGSLNILEGTASEISNILDVLDTFTFVERRSIDGFHDGVGVWQHQGPILSLLRTVSNEAINELFFDLRPLSDDGEGSIADEPVAGRYTRVHDDVGGNEDPDGGPMGITYVPAVVMREYPFSTIDGLDLRDVEVTLRASDGTKETVGIVSFGSIFSDEPNQPGRHVVSVPNINWGDRANGSSTARAAKTLDVAVVSEKEIMKHQLGRSDNEHFNLFEFYSDSLIGQDQRFYMHDLLPITTPIHIARHGLRVRSITTRFARFGASALQKSNAPVSDEEVEDLEEDFEGEVPVADSWGNIIDIDSSAVVTTGRQNKPTNYFEGQISSKYGYRLKATEKGGPKDTWIFHNGNDVMGNVGTTVRAAANGIVVGSFSNGVLAGYGETIFIKHTEPDGTVYFTMYSHLSERLVAKKKTTSFADGFAEDVRAGGKFEPGPIVKKGDPIGLVGQTDSSTSGTFSSPPHCHFEILPNSAQIYPSRNKAVTPNLPKDDPEGGYWTGENPKSLDPEAFYEERGVTFQVFNPGDDFDADNIDDDTDDAVSSSRKGADVEELPDQASPKTTRGAVDTALTRSQIIRWALLQDHWYQHNLEYLSGRLDMRGAPEIRVGYRLDIDERDMSFYVEGVNHSWKYPDKMMTSLQVTRGQPNRPYPMYVFPKVESFNPTKDQRKSAKSRLATYFITPDPVAVQRATVLHGKSFNIDRTISPLIPYAADGSNITDLNMRDDFGVHTDYNEKVMPAGTTEVSSLLDEEQIDANQAEDAVEDIDDQSILGGVEGTDDGAFTNDELLENIQDNL